MFTSNCHKVVGWAGWLIVFGLGLALTGCLAGSPAVPTQAPPTQAVSTQAPATEVSATQASATTTPEVFIPRTVVVPNGPMVTGRVLWGAGPVAGVQVELRTGDWTAGAESTNGETIAQAISDNSGVYAIEAPPNGGDFGLVAIWPDGAANTAPVTLVQVAAGGAGVEADVALARPLDWLAPTPGTTVGSSTTLRWHAVQDATMYRVWVIDAGTTELAFSVDVPATAGGDPGLVLTPLNGDRTYTWDVQALDAQGALLARLTGSFQTSGQASLPDSCRVDDLSTYVDQVNHFCFAYPTTFTAQVDEAGRALITGPALDSAVEPLRASLLIEAGPAPAGKTLTQIVDDYVAQFAGLDVPPITRMANVLAGQPSELLDPVPGREGSRDIFMLHNGTLYHLMFMPSVADFPQAASDVELLSVNVVASFSLMAAAN